MGRILLIEDDGDQRELRQSILELAGHEVLTASTPDEALSLLGREPATALLDLGLPGEEDGMRLLRQLRGSNAAMRIVVVSGWTANLLARDEAKLADRILQKPVRTQELLHLLE
ncbi:MAG: response regulator [Acidobacteria bacterium]|nr:response regulator [Acidobacteriota bacterium]